MFTPLAFSKNNNINTDRFNNELYPTDTSAKRLGLAIPQNTYFTPGAGTETGTVVVQAYPNSDYLPTAFSAETKYMLWASEPVNYSSWWHFYIATQNGTQIGSPSNYSLLGSNGILRGSYALVFRERSTGGSNQDALVLFDSGSYYDWTGGEEKPVRMAVTYDRTSDVFRASLNGNTMSASFQNRSGYNVGTNKWMTDIAPSGGSTSTTMYSPKINTSLANSGSMGEWAYYSSSLSQDELNLMTNQPYGQPTNVLDKQPQILHRFREEQKETMVASPSITDQLAGNTAYPNLGSISATVGQAKSVRDTTGNGTITSGSTLNTQNEEYYTRQ